MRHKDGARPESLIVVEIIFLEGLATFDSVLSEFGDNCGTVPDVES